MEENVNPTRLLLITLVALNLACEPKERNTEDQKAADAPAPMLTLRLPRWAQRSADIRSARRSDSQVTARLDRGERLEIGDVIDGWAEIFRDGSSIGYARESVLRSSPLPAKEFQMKDVSFRVSNEGSSAWTYEWSLDLENTGLESYPALEAELKFVDAGRHLIATDTAYGMSLTPGQRRTFTGNLQVPLPLGSTIRNVGAEIREP